MLLFSSWRPRGRSRIVSLLNIFQTIKNKLAGTAEAAASAALHTGIPAAMPPGDPALLALLGTVLSAEKIAFTVQPAYLRLESGICLTITAIEQKPLAEQRVKTCTSIFAWHPQYFAEGMSEYQHALGSDESAAMTEGIQNWVRMDLLTLIDAVADYPQHCTVIELNTASAEQQQQRYRQVILGPVAHLASLPEKKKEEHPFCPCCLFTESMPAFHDLLQTERFLGVRLFASRDQQGQAAADCRVNGEDFAAALPLLTAYVEKWPQRGLEFRKQLIVVRSSTHSIHQKALTVKQSG